MTTATVPVQRELFDLVTTSVVAGLPLPVTISLYQGARSSLELWMDRPEDVRPWVQRFGLVWEAVAVYPSGRGGWQWSVCAESSRTDGVLARRAVRVRYCHALPGEGPVHLPA